MHAWPVIGRVFIRLLTDAKPFWEVCMGLARRNVPAIGNEWAPFPFIRWLVPLVPTARDREISWRYTTEQPGKSWMAHVFDDRTWK